MQVLWGGARDIGQGIIAPTPVVPVKTTYLGDMKSVLLYPLDQGTRSIPVRRHRLAGRASRNAHISLLGIYNTRIFASIYRSSHE